MKPAPSSGKAAPDDTWHQQMVKAANDKAAADAAKEAASKPKPKAAPKANPPSYKKGTDYVPKTGTAKLHKGEAVLPKETADKYREAKMTHHFDVSDELAGTKEEKPKKEIHHIKTRKAKTGGYIHTHVHTRPEHHPDEEHVSATQDDMVHHMLQNMGEPNPGEAEADAGQSGLPAQGGAPTAAAPVAPPQAGM